MMQIVPVGGEITPIGAAMPEAPAIVPVGGEVRPIGAEMPAPDFRTSNDPVQATQLAAKQREEAAQKEYDAKPSWFELGSEMVKGWAAANNPLPLLRAMYDDESKHWMEADKAARRGDYLSMFGEQLQAFGGPGKTIVSGLVGQHWQQFVKAKKAYDKGDYSEAAGYTAAGLMPIVGPMAAQAGEEIGTGDPRTIARGVGTATAALRPQLAGEVVGGVVRKAVGAVDALGRKVVGGVTVNPAEAASNAFATERAIPLDAATATGSKWARAAQKRTANSLGGEAGAADLIKAQREGLERVGGELTGEANAEQPGVPGAAVFPEEAAEGVRGSIRDLITTLHDQASKKYGELRKFEAAPENADTVPTAPAPVDAVKDWQRAQLRRISHELDVDYTPATWVDLGEAEGVKDGNAGGGQYQRTPARAGGAVLHDIHDKLGYEGLDRGDVKAEIDSFLAGGKETKTVKAALDVARGRYIGDRKLRTAELPASVMEDLTPGERARKTSQAMGLAVDMREAKKALIPIRDHMGAGGQIAPLMGAKATAFAALQRLINGPDHAPLSVVDAALGDLKALARGGKSGPAVPELRTAGQGTAAYAVAQLEKLVRARAAEAGPDVLAALEEGRSATKAKADVGRVLEKLREEPIEAFRQMTRPKDGGIKMLRAVRDVAPMKMQDVARAWLEQQMALAKREGGFGHTDRLWSDWNELGKETKRVLFPAPGQTQALDRFFLLAKRIGENPNPSGTAHNLTAINVSSVPVTALLSKLLYTKRGVDALTRWMEATPGAKAAAGAGSGARTAAWAAVMSAAKRVGVDLPAAVPLAADGDEKR